MMIVAPPATPESLEATARQCTVDAERCDAEGKPKLAEGYRTRARRLLEQAAQLRARRTDGVRFG